MLLPLFAAIVILIEEKSGHGTLGDEEKYEPDPIAGPEYRHSERMSSTYFNETSSKGNSSSRVIREEVC